MYNYEIGDLIILKNEISYLARKYTYLKNEKIFDSFITLNNDDLFIVTAKEDEFSPNSIKIFNSKTGDLLEAYPHIFLKVNDEIK
jgi:hypothetical protein